MRGISRFRYRPFRFGNFVGNIVKATLSAVRLSLEGIGRVRIFNKQDAVDVASPTAPAPVAPEVGHAVDAHSALGRFRQNLTEVIKARFPIVQIVTFEEERGIRELRRLAEKLGHKMVFWSASRGVHRENEDGDKTNGKLGELDFAQAIEVFEKNAEKKEPYLFILIDPYPYLEAKGTNPIYRRKLRDFAIDIRTKGYHANCVILSPCLEIPIELEKEITVLDLPLPDREEVRSLVERIIASFQDAEIVSIGGNGTLITSLVDASLGLTYQEIENVLSRSVIDDLRLDHSDVKMILRQKQQIVRKSGVLDFFDTKDLSSEDLGGLQVLKQWLEIRSYGFSEDARAFGLTTPKGILLTGVPGCGKSLAAKCIAATWSLPLIKFDVGRIYSRWIGSSEENIRHAIATCESVAPCVLWIDEIEKGFPKPSASYGDSGVAMRVLGSFLTWLQEKTAPVFVFATSNDINLLPTEILRKGRFDEVFFVDLPNREERAEILNIHIRRTGRDPGKVDIERLAKISGEDRFGEGVSLSGAEIESWVNESLMHAFYRRQTKVPDADLTMDDFETVIGRIVPIARLRRADLDGMRTWANDHAINASLSDAVATKDITVGGRYLNL